MNDQITVSRELLRQALAQLEINRTNFYKGPSKSMCKCLAGGNDEAITALRATLEQPAMEPVHGDVLPPIGSRVFIRHGRDDDAHACTVTGYYAWGDLGGNKRLSRVFVRLVYEGTDRQQARMLCDCWPTADAALNSTAPQAQQPAVEPVAEVVYLERGGNAGIATRIVEIYDPLRERLQAGTKLYTSPQPQQPANVPLLTDYEIDMIGADPTHDTLQDAYRAIERAVRRKAGLK